MNHFPDNRAQRASPSYRLPALDADFLLDDSQRGTRLMLELLVEQQPAYLYGVESLLLQLAKGHHRQT